MAWCTSCLSVGHGAVRKNGVMILYQLPDSTA